MLLSFSHEGKTYTNFSSKEALDAGVPKAIVDEQVAGLAAQSARAGVRSIISKNVGDTASLLGTVSDATGILVAMALADVVALHGSTTFAQYKAAKEGVFTALAGEADIAEIASQALAKIQSGDVVLTAHVKGLENVITESLTRSNDVSTILVEAAGE